MKKVLLKSGAILNVADDRAAAIMYALEKDVDSYGIYLNGANGSHQGFVRLDAIDAVIDYEILTKNQNNTNENRISWSLVYRVPYSQIDRCNRLVVVVDNKPAVDWLTYLLCPLPCPLCLVLLWGDSQKATILIPERFSAVVRFRRREQINNILLAMTQEQFNFLEGFGAYLTRRGFRVSKSLYEAEAIAEAELFGTLSVACRFAWKWQGAYSSVLLQIRIETLMLERSLPTALLMDYEGAGTEIITIVIRNLMQEAADKIALQLIQK